MGRWLALLGLALLAVGSCGVPLEVPPREPVLLPDVERAASAFDALARAGWDAWTLDDAKAVKSAFSEDAVFHDATFGDHAVGIDEVKHLILNVSMLFPSWEAQITDRYIGLEEGLAVSGSWNLNLGGHAFTQADPLVSVDWLQIRDGHITYWRAFYGLNSLEDAGQATEQRIDQAISLLSSYASAWSSEDPQVVSRLYSESVVREDTLFGERLEGRAVVSSFARKFFDWYPGTQWSLSLGFGDSLGDLPTTGGLYSLKVLDLTGQPCELHVAVLLQTSEEQIVHEALYYQPESLARCAWAR